MKKPGPNYKTIPVIDATKIRVDAMQVKNCEHPFSRQPHLLRHHPICLRLREEPYPELPELCISFEHGDLRPMTDFKQLDKGQLAYRDSDGNLMILPVDDDDIRQAFIGRLASEYIEDRELDKLLERFEQSAKDAVNDNTKSVEAREKGDPE